MKLNSENDTQTILSHSDNFWSNSDNQAGWMFYQTGPAFRWWEKNINGGYSHLDVNPLNINDDSWHHISIAREGDNFNFYLDGNNWNLNVMKLVQIVYMMKMDYLLMKILI